MFLSVLSGIAVLHRVYNNLQKILTLTLEEEEEEDIDMNPHFSQNILNKGIFQMWIHHYIDMNPHKSKPIKVVYL